MEVQQRNETARADGQRVQPRVELDEAISASAARIKLMRDREPIGEAALRELVQEALQELSTTIEELRVSEEEMRAQNSELLEAHVAAEREAQRYLELFQLAPDAYFNTNAEAVISEANRAAAEVVGLDEALLRGKPLAVFFSGEDRRAFRSFTNRVRQSRSTVDAELEMVARNSRPVRLAIRATAARDQNGRVVSISWIMRDVTHREQAEETNRKLVQERSDRVSAEDTANRLQFLSDTGQLLAATFDAGNTVEVLASSAVRFNADACFVHMVEPDGTLQLASEAFRDPSREDFARTVQKRFHLDCSAEKGPLQRAVETGEPQLLPEIPAAVIAGGGPNAYFAAMRKLGPRYGMVVPLCARGRCLGVITFLAVQTSPLYTAEDLRLALELATRAAMQIDNVRLYNEAQAANRAKADFLAVVSHELRTPLTAVIGYAELLLGGIPSADEARSQHFLERIRASAWHQLGLVEEILAYARLDAAAEALNIEDVDIVGVASEAVNLSMPSAEQKGLVFDVALPDDAMMVEGDRGKLRQVLINLLSNAVKFTDTGRISLTLVRHGDIGEVTVADTGAGIAPEHVGKIFDAFWQAESPQTRTYGGAGLGLSVCRRLVALMKGEILVDSTLGEGTTFTVRFPLATTRRSE